MIGSVSASEDYNISDDTVLAEQAFNVDDDINVDASNNLKQESVSDGVICENQNNQTTDILTKDNTNSAIKQDLISYSENENKSIISNANTIELIGNNETNNFNFSNLYNNLIDYITTSDDFQQIQLLREVFDDNDNYETFISGLNEVINGIEINYTKIIDSIMNTTFINDFNITNELTDKFNINISDVISFNSTAIYDNIADILNEFNITNKDVLNLFENIKTSFNLNTTNTIDNNISDLKNLNTLNLTKIFNVLSEVIKYNNLTFNNINFTKFSLNITDIIDKLSTSKFNISNIEHAFKNLLTNSIVSINISKILPSFAGITEISDGINEMLSSFKLNTTSAYENLIKFLNGITINLTNFDVEVGSDLGDVISNSILKLDNFTHFIKGFIEINNLTIADIINIISNFTNGSSFNVTDFINNVKDLNTSKINDTLNKFISYFNINTTVMQNGFEGIAKSINVNETIFMNGTLKFLNGTIIYITDIIDEISNVIDKIEFNKTSIDALIDNINDSINVDYFSVLSGLSKMISALNASASNYGENIKNISDSIRESINVISDKVYDYLSKLFESNSSTDIPQKEVVTPSEKSTETTKLSTSKITASSKTFKKSIKIKKYTITLKSAKKAIKKVKVTLKINGKTYSATTNNKGKATFKIKKLTKKGKYNTIIKFKGNKLYKSATKKVKIIIK